MQCIACSIECSAVCGTIGGTLRYILLRKIFNLIHTSIPSILLSLICLQYSLYYNT